MKVNDLASLQKAILSDDISDPITLDVTNLDFFTLVRLRETLQELPDNKYYIFGKEGAKHLSEDLKVQFLGEIPLVQSIREAGDAGRPAALQMDTPLERAFEVLTQNVVLEVVRRNDDLPPTEAIKITTMAGCSAFNK